MQLVYNSRLKSLVVDGKEVNGFSDGVFDYQLPADLQGKDIVATAFGKDATVETVTEGNVTTVTVKDETAMGEKVNTYTLTFKGVSAESSCCRDSGVDLWRRGGWFGLYFQ